MELITERTQFAPHVGIYARAAVPIETFDRGWKLAAGSAVVVNTGEAFELIIEGECTSLEYARMIASLGESGIALQSVTMPFALGQQLNNPDARDWYWLAKESPFPVAPVPEHTRIVKGSDYDSEISRFLQLAAPDSAVMPGNPEILFWVLSRASTGSSKPSPLAHNGVQVRASSTLWPSIPRSDVKVWANW